MSAEPNISRYASPGVGSVNTYWIETANGVVVVDGQRQISQARNVLAEIGKSGKAVLAVLLTHGHPDHYGGLNAFHEAYPDAPIYASADTIAVVRDDPHHYGDLARTAFGDDFPAQISWPMTILPKNEPVQVDGLEWTAREFGVGESESATVFCGTGMPTIFVGDIVGNGFVPFLIEGRSALWLDAIDALAAAFPSSAVFSPGHGVPAPASELIAAERAALVAMRDAVMQAIARNGGWSDAARTDALAQVAGRFDGLPVPADIPGLVGLNLDAVAREMAQKDSPT